jgi:hypothetical protein
MTKILLKTTRLETEVQGELRYNDSACSYLLKNNHFLESFCGEDHSYVGFTQEPMISLKMVSELLD